MTELEWDWNLGIPNLASNVFLRLLVPVDKPSNEANSAHVKRLCNEILSRYEVANHRPLLVRGVKEASSIPPMQQALPGGVTVPVYDPDVQILVENTSRVVTEDSSPNDSAAAVIETLSSGQLLLRALDTFDSSLVTEEDGSRVLRSDAFMSGVPAEVSGGTGLSFPAPDLQDTGLHPRPTPTWQHSYAWRCLNWPRAAQPWASRRRQHNWPSEETIQAVLSGGCHVIPISGQENNGGRNIKWQFSFACAEQCLFNTLKPIQKHVFLLFKILHFQCLSHPRIVSTEHLRSVFFHACERLPPGSWQEDQLAALTMYLVDELFHAFVNGSLPNYFLPEEDLLAGIDDDFLWEVQRRLVDMRTKALWFFLDFTRAFRFSWTPVITESFAENIKNTLVGKQSITNVGACLQSILVPLVMSLGTAIASPCLEPEGNDVPIDKAMEFIIYGLKVIRDCTGLDVSLDAILNIFIMAPKSALLRIRLLEYVIQRCPNSPEISSFYGNLACMYHVHYWELDTNERKELHTKIDQTFQKAISHTESGAATMTDYANFLCRMGDWEEAIPKLHEAIKKDADHSQAGANSYDLTELSTLDEDLQAIVRCTGIISVMSTAYCQYLLAFCYRNEGKVDEARATVDRFATWCKKRFPPNDNKEIEVCEVSSWVLLGHAFKQLSSYSMAFSSLMTAFKRSSDQWNICLLDQIQFVHGLAISVDPSWSPEENLPGDSGAPAPPPPQDQETKEYIGEAYIEEDKELQQAITLSLKTAAAESPDADSDHLHEETGQEESVSEDEEEQLRRALKMSLEISDE